MSKPLSIFVVEILRLDGKPYKKRQWDAWGNKLSNAYPKLTREAAEEHMSAHTRVVEFVEKIEP